MVSRKEIYMRLYEEDVKKFYQLYIRYDIKSPNIAIVGNYDKFNRYIKAILKDYKNKKGVKLIINEEKTKYTIIEDDIETTYMYIRDTEDLRGKYFRKFI